MWAASPRAARAGRTDSDWKRFVKANRPSTNIYLFFPKFPQSRIQTAFPQDENKNPFHACTNQGATWRGIISESDGSYVYGRTWELYAGERSLLFACYYQQINTTLTQKCTNIWHDKHMMPRLGKSSYVAAEQLLSLFCFFKSIICCCSVRGFLKSRVRIKTRNIFAKLNEHCAHSHLPTTQ